MTIKISFIIPVYNGEQYVDECLARLYSSPLNISDFEIVIVNDASTDNTAIKLLEYQMKYQNIHLITNSQNKRAGGSRNVGIKAAKGEYVAFLDIDDYFENSQINTILNLALNQHLDVISFGFDKEIKPDTWVSNLITDKASPVVSGIEFCENYINPGLSFMSPTHWYRREFLLEKKIWFPENVIWEDDWVVKILFSADRIQYVPVVLYKYVYNQASISRNINVNLVVDLIALGFRKYEFAESIKEISKSYANLLVKDGLWNATCIRKAWKLKPSDTIILYRLINKLKLKKSFIQQTDSKIRFFFTFPVFMKTISCIMYPVIQLKKRKI
jgi:glycosyltransferase involved in cell wall biosynthesis